METESRNEGISLFFILTVCYLDDVIRNKVVINIADESNKDRSLNIVSPTEELLVPPENRLEIQSRLEQMFHRIFFRSRRGSTTGPPRRDLMLEHKISKWIISLDGDSRPSSSKSPPGDFGGWLEDGSVLSG